MRLPGLSPHRHEDSYPFLSGDTLRAYADMVFEREVTYLYVATRNRWTVHPRNRTMRHGDVIFVKTDDVEQFAADVAPKLNRKFVLLTHNSDLSAPVGPGSLRLLEHPHLLCWFAENAARAHPRLRPVPIGLQNQQWGRSGVVDRIEKFLR